MDLEKHIFLNTFIILSIYVGTSIQENAIPSDAQFEISQVINELNKAKTIVRRKFETTARQNFLTPSNSLRHANDPIIDRICKKTGCSCGRSSFPCDAQDIFNVANEVDEVIDNMDRFDILNQDKDDSLRCGHGCKKLYKQKSVETNTDDQNLLEAVLSELSEISKAENTGRFKLSTREALTPEDIYNYYRAAMEQVRETLMGFIKYRTNLSVVRGLPRDVRKGIQAIRDRYRHFKMSDKSLKKQIFQVLLDDLLKIKIVANKDPEVSYDVFMPDWMYLEVLKKKRGKLLRSGKRSAIKRILPLTLQQKKRLQNKQRPKKILKFVWRRSLGSDISRYGVPFVLDIQGLGQLN